jgi:membrane-bound lytic murein transglycosylase B
MMSIRQRLSGLLLSFACASAAAPAEAPTSYLEGARDFAAEMVSRHGFDGGEVAALIAQARFRQDIIDAIRRPWEARPWHEYRSIFLTPERIQAGVRFWQAHQTTLGRAEEQFGVPPEIITAIIGVETSYGKSLGRHRVIDALTTLGFSYPERSQFFRKELAEFLLLTRAEGLDALEVNGSYAGAMGMPQFISSSYRAYAVDFDGDGRRDLWGSPADAIGSVASYLARHGWRSGEPVVQRARVREAIPAGMPVAEKSPRSPEIGIARLKRAGITPVGSLPSAGEVTLVRLESPEDEYWLGFANFYVITRYNHSNLYAMAVFQLSREIKGRYRAAE